MAFKNFTPLTCFPMDAKAPGGERLSIIIVKTTLDLVPAPPALQARGFTHFLKLSQEQQPLALTDTYHGAPFTSSLRWESDLAFAKPRCDVVVLGEAHAPGGKPSRRFQVGLKLTAAEQDRPLPPKPAPLGPGMPPTFEELRAWQQEVALAKARPIPGATLVEKRIQVTGARWLRLRLGAIRFGWWLIKVATLGLLRRCPWVLTWPTPITVLPLQYEYAFGGQVQAQASAPWAGRVPQRHCLPGVEKTKRRQAWQATRAEALIAEGLWHENFVGRGYAPHWYLKAARIKRLPAPQFEDPAHPFTAKAAWQAMLGKVSGRFRLALRPQNLGVSARNTQPRLQLAGTWDQAWVASGAPYPPDYQTAFNNYAHPELQCRHLDGDEVVELTNLCAKATPGVGRDRRGNQLLRFQLPGLFPFVLLEYETGESVQLPGVLDTLVLEPSEGRVTLLHRVSYAQAPEPEVVELRLALPGESREVPSKQLNQ